ncbi:sigma-54 dependent transcriptional regulator [Chryseobacterium sp. MYb264]|uniref:sigma-54 interaction domain-containing protein n=1 Tax=Chryseobacterium sp. MYb264 TaxID=2745153 RepID=UPI002E0E75CA|nr:sigma-54 dependent transcriptional regulator [Chryseobacterium sp. MYb264]
MDKQSDQHLLLMKRLQEMQREQLTISALNTSFAKVLDKKELHFILNQNAKQELKFNEMIILKADNAVVQTFYSSFSNGEDNEKPTDPYFEQCLDSAEPVLFNLKELSEKKNTTPSYFLTAKNSGIRIAVGFSLPVIQESQHVVFLFYKSFISADDIRERILEGISTQLSITIRNISIQEQLKFLQNNQIFSATEINTEKQQAKKGFHGIIGDSNLMQEIYEQISQVAPSLSNVIIYGETGTGKELIAQAIHELSEASNQQMIRINCAAIPANLIESELFGHEKGSFTGATEQRKGKFEQAHNSTIFLDEIGELPLELQGRLLRVLQEKEVERIGGTQRIKVNARVIAATNRNLAKEVEKGDFRSDLFYRLNVFPIYLPALRERKEDIELLALYFLEKHSEKAGRKVKGFSKKVIDSMIENSWPGNIRELENMVERSILTTKTATITEMEFPKIINPEHTENHFQIKTLHEFEKEYILKVVEKCNGRISGKNGAAVLLGLPSTTLISKMQKLGIKKEHHFKTGE